MNSRNRNPWAASLLALALLLSLTGCFGRKEAAKVATQMSATADRAAELIVKVEESDRRKVEALEKLHAALLDAKKVEGEKAVEARAAKWLSDLNAQEAAALRSLLELRRTMLNDFFARVAAQKQPLVLALEAAKTKSSNAKKALDEYPNDQDRRRALEDADRQYLAVGATLQQLEASSAGAAYTQTDQVVADISATIGQAAATARAQVDSGVATAKARIAAKRAAVAAGQALPPKDTEAYAALLQFAQAVKSGASAYTNYLAANSFAGDSFAGEFAKSFVDGLVPGTLRALRGETVSGDEVVRLATDVARDFTADAQQALTDDLTSLGKTFDQSVVQAKADATNAIATKTTEFINANLAKIFGAAGNQNGANAAPAPVNTPAP